MHNSGKSENIIIDRLTPITDINIKSISEKSDDNDIYLSIYFPIGNKNDNKVNNKFLTSRINNIRKALPEKFKDQFEDLINTSKKYCSLPQLKGEKGRILFVSQSTIYVFRIPLEPERYLVLDNSPFLLPLARLRDDYSDYGIVLLDSHEYRLFNIRSDAVEQTSHLSTDLMNKHKKGGWSQMRFNRLRKEAIKSFFSSVAESIEEYCKNHQVKGLIIAGPGDAKKELRDILPEGIRNKVMDIIDTPMDVSEKELVNTGDIILKTNEKSYSREKANEFRAAVLSGGLAEYGIDAIKNDLYQGRVSVLLILNNIAVPGSKCEKCQELHVTGNSYPACPICGGTTSKTEIIEKLYEMAQYTNAEVEFVDDDTFLESIGGVGAILRY